VFVGVKGAVLAMTQVAYSIRGFKTGVGFHSENVGIV